MNKKAAMSEPKRKSAGLDKRREILVQNKYDLSFLSTRVGSFREHGWDDLVDACAAAWTAERILTDQAVRFPAKPVFDSTGLDMAIWA
jgi:predicted RNase H-like nuclease